MKGNSILESQSCIDIESLDILKIYMSNLKSGFSPSSVGPPFPVKIYYRATIENIKLAHFKFYNEKEKIKREEIHIISTINDTLTDFSYCITLKNNKIELEYESPESHIIYEELRIKYENHFCELIKKVKNLNN